MTIQQTEAVTNLSLATSEFVRAALIAKMSFDFPDELNSDFANTLKIIDTKGLEIDEKVLKANYDSVTELVEKKYPELGKKLVEEVAHIVSNSVFK